VEFRLCLPIAKLPLLLVKILPRISVPGISMVSSFVVVVVVVVVQW
jgi:hypothetical protein